MAFFGLQTPQNYKYWYIKLFWMFGNPNTPLWPRKNLHFWKFQNFSIFLGVEKVRFLGPEGGVWALNPFIRSSNIWGYMVLSFFGSKKVNFKENIGGALKAPPTRKRIFSTPPGIGLTNELTDELTNELTDELTNETEKNSVYAANSLLLYLVCDLFQSW